MFGISFVNAQRLMVISPEPFDVVLADGLALADELALADGLAPALLDESLLLPLPHAASTEDIARTAETPAKVRFMLFLPLMFNTVTL